MALFCAGSCWERVGGFPELVSEDLAFALRIREQGWRGHFAEDVVCYEDFPESIRAFRTRHMKWTRGTCEFLSKEMLRLTFSRRIPTVEKLDILFPTLNLPFSLFYFLFLVDANLVLSLLFSEPHPITLALAGAEWVLPYRMLHPQFNVINGVDFFAITLLTLLAPVLCFVIDLARRPGELVRFLARSTAVYGSLGPLSCVGVLLYVVTGKAIFHVTADRSAAAAAGTAALTPRQKWYTGLRCLFSGSHPDHRGVQGFEVFCGTALGALCITRFQLSALGLAVAFVLLPVLHHVSWSHRVMRTLIYLPFMLLVTGLFLGGLTLIGMQTVFFGFGFHF